MTSPTVSEPGPAAPAPHGPFAALRRKLPAREVVLFLLVGGFNTAFGYALYVALVYAFGHSLPTLSKVWIAPLANLIAKPIGIVVAFLGYKHFVFRTHGNYLKELLRCFAVYGAYIPVEMVILAVATRLLLIPHLTHSHAPQLAGIVNSALVASYSYFAHKKFSFKR